MTEDSQPTTPTEAASVPSQAKPAKPGPVPVTEPVCHPALLESLAALGLLLVVAYTCWRLYGVEIGRMFTALFH